MITLFRTIQDIDEVFSLSDDGFSGDLGLTDYCGCEAETMGSMDRGHSLCSHSNGQSSFILHGLYTLD